MPFESAATFKLAKVCCVEDKCGSRCELILQVQCVEGERLALPSSAGQPAGQMVVDQSDGSRTSGKGRSCLKHSSLRYRLDSYSDWRRA